METGSVGLASHPPAGPGWTLPTETPEKEQRPEMPH